MSQMNPAILYEDPHLLVVDKPAGLVVHSDGRTEEPTLVDWVKMHYPTLKDVGGLHTLDSERYVERFGIVHRLDRETSGVIMIAKDDEEFYFLQRQFLDHTITKTYNAFVLGVPTPKQGSIGAPIGRSRSDFRQWTTGADARGTQRDASTAYNTLATSTDGKYAFIELTPKTGRTHQLRVHMKSIGHPILCDARYGTPTGLGFSRLALHAVSIQVRLPGDELKTFVAPLPADFIEARKVLENNPSKH